MRIVLCSSSPRRRELLARLGLDFETFDSDLEEHLTGLTPNELVTRLALDKARAIQSRIAGGIVISADTVIDLDGVALGKPANGIDAVRMLSRLSGRAHLVLTGIAALDTANGKELVSSVATRVTMRAYSKSEVEDYVRTGEPLDKAGAYAIQGRGSELVKEIKGCYFNVVGFPLCELAKLLSTFGVHTRSEGPVCSGPEGWPCPRLTELPTLGADGPRAEPDTNGNPCGGAS